MGLLLGRFYSKGFQTGLQSTSWGFLNRSGALGEGTAAFFKTISTTLSP